VIHDSIPLLMQYNIYSYSSDNSWESVYNSERSNDNMILVKSSQLRFCIYIFIHTYVQLRIYLSIPSHPILSFFLQKDIQWLTYVVKVAIPTRFHDHFVSNSFLFSLTLSFSQPWRFGWRMLAQRESKIRFRYLDKPSKYNQLLWTRRSSRIVWFSPWIVGSMTRGLWYLYVFFFQSVCHKWGLP
jgi:hypothetical protein